MFDRFKDWLALTRTERNVILFLCVTLAIGAGIKLYRLTFPPRPAFDYRASDSTFAALSQAPDEQEESPRTPAVININSASKEELMKLPGVGEVLAERILIHRDEIGRFTTFDQLLTIRGISKKKLEQLKPLITLH